MLDTIVLNLAEGEYMLTNEELYQPELARVRRAGIWSGCKVIQNPSAADKRAGIYKPRLTFYGRPVLGRITVELRIEFSAPKVLFKNNFEELRDADFPHLLEELQHKLEACGVKVFYAVLEKARPSALHFSKNFVFEDGTTSSAIIAELSKADVTKRLDATKAKFRNEGHGFAWHTNSFEVVFYDKIADLIQAKISEKRSFEVDNQLALPLDIFPKNQPFEVMRFEVRLARVKLKSVLKKFGISPDASLAELFSSELAMKVLNDFWQDSTEGLRYLLPQTAKSDPGNYLRHLQRLNPSVKLTKLMQSQSAITIIDHSGFRSFRSQFEKSKHLNWPRFKQELASLRLPAGPLHSYKLVEERLKAKYEPIKFAAYSQLVLTNDKERHTQNDKPQLPSPYND